MSQIDVLQENTDFYKLLQSEILPEIFYHNRNMYKIYQFLGIIPLFLVTLVNFIRPIPEIIDSSQYCSYWDTIAYLFTRLNFVYHLIDLFQVIFHIYSISNVGSFIHHAAAIYFLPDLTQQKYYPWSISFLFFCHSIYFSYQDCFALEVLYFCSVLIVFYHTSKEPFCQVESYEKAKKLFPVFVVSLLLMGCRHIIDYGIEMQNEYLNENQ